MRVWLVTVGEPLPTDHGNPRLIRTGVLANYLLAAGHTVVWWTSTFDHSIKKHRFSKQTKVKYSDGYEIIALHGRGYSKNVSISRILNHRDVACAFPKSARLEVQPDIVLTSFPTIELCHEVVQFCKEKRIPCVTDVRDLWPDVLVSAFPGWMRPVARLLSRGMERQTRSIFESSTHIAGITNSYLEWGLSKGARMKSVDDHVYSLTNIRPEYTDETLDSAEQDLKRLGLDDTKTIVVFVGIISNRKFCLDTVAQGIGLIQKRIPNLQFVFAGDGDDYLKLKSEYPDIVYTGWVDAPKIQVLLRSATIALAPYRSSEEFRMSIPIKIFEYMSLGTPILTSLRGEVEELIDSKNLGLFFSEDDPDSFVDGIELMLKDETRLAEMSGNCTLVYARDYSADRTYKLRVEHMEAIYHKSLGTP